MEIRLVSVELFRTDRQMTKLIIVFRNFSNVRETASVQIITYLPYIITFVCHTSVEGTDLQVANESSCSNIYGLSSDYNAMLLQRSVGPQC
jgi:peroxiredoxin